MFLPSRLLFVFILSLFLAVSLAAETAETLLLDENGFAYIFTDVKRSRSIIEILPVEELKNWQAIYVMENTDIAAAALFNRESGRRFQAVGRGNYPQFRAGVALFFHPNWRRQRTETGHYWYSVRDRLSISINADEVFAVSWHDNHVNPVPASSRVQIPEGFEEFKKDSPLSCWLNNAGQLMNQIFESEEMQINLPARQLFININPVALENSSYQFEVTLRFRFENAAQAQSASAVLSRYDFQPSSETALALAAVFFAGPSVLHGRDLELHTPGLSIHEVTLLLQKFIVFWN